MDSNLIAFYVIFGLISILGSVAIYMVARKMIINKKYLAEIEMKNQVWLEARGLSDTTNKTIMGRFFCLGRTNTFVIRKIQSNTKGNEISITFSVNGQEVNLDLDIASVAFVITDSPIYPNAEFTFNQEYMNLEYNKTRDTWEDETKHILPKDFLYLANITIYLSKEIHAKLSAPVFEL